MIIRLNGWKQVYGPQKYSKNSKYNADHHSDIMYLYRLRELKIFLSSTRIKNHNSNGLTKR